MSPKEAGRLGGQATYGEAKGTSKLTEPEVLYVLTSSEPVTQLARQLRISHSTVSRVRQRLLWKHIVPRGTSYEHPVDKL